MWTQQNMRVLCWGLVSASEGGRSLLDLIFPLYLWTSHYQKMRVNVALKSYKYSKTHNTIVMIELLVLETPFKKYVVFG